MFFIWSQTLAYNVHIVLFFNFYSIYDSCECICKRSERHLTFKMITRLVRLLTFRHRCNACWRVLFGTTFQTRVKRQKVPNSQYKCSLKTVTRVKYKNTIQLKTAWVFYKQGPCLILTKKCWHKINVLGQTNI